VAVFAGLCWLVALALGDLTGVLVGALAVVSGVMEVRGHRQLRRGDAGGMKWLIRAQLLLLGVILAYSAARIVSFDRELALANLTPDMRDALNQLGMQPEELIPLIQRVLWAFYSAVMLTTCLYQGGLAVYYRRRTPLVVEALAVPPPIAPQPPAVAAPSSSGPPPEYSI
jgi:hypothetical protein